MLARGLCILVCVNNLSKILAAAATALTGAAGKAEAQEPPPAQQVRQAPEHMRIPRGIDAQPPPERIEPEILQRSPLGAVDAPEIPIGEPREREDLGAEDVGEALGITQRSTIANGELTTGVVDTGDETIAGAEIRWRNNPYN